MIDYLYRDCSWLLQDRLKIEEKLYFRIKLNYLHLLTQGSVAQFDSYDNKPTEVIWQMNVTCDQ